MKSGYLKLVQAGDDQLRLGTRWSRQANGSTRKALSLVRELVSKAYGEHPAVNQALDNYLSGRGNGRMGTQSFVKLVRDLEASAGSVGSAGSRLAQARVAHARLDTRAFAEALASPSDPPTSSLMHEQPQETVVGNIISSESSAQVPLQVAQQPVLAAQPGQVAPDDLEVPILGGPVDAEPTQAPTAVSAATVRLTKAAGFSVHYEGQALEGRRFTLLGTGPHRELGALIDGALADQGLKAPPGVSRIKVNDDWVYCVFDAAGKARAILPKGEDRSPREVPILSIGDYGDISDFSFDKFFMGISRAARPSWATPAGWPRKSYRRSWVSMDVTRRS